MSTFRNDSKIQAAFDRGYTASADAMNPFLWSSGLWEAFELGRFFNLNAIESDLVAPSRGHSFRTARLSVFRLRYNGASVAIAETRVAESAPLLTALEQAVTALNTAPRFAVPSLDTDSCRIAALCDLAIAKAKGGAR